MLINQLPMQQSDSERIKQLVSECAHGNKSEFARLIGVSSQLISNVINGKNKMSIELFQSIISKYPNIDLKWLLNGSETESNNRLAKNILENIHLTHNVDSENNPQAENKPSKKDDMIENYERIINAKDNEIAAKNNEIAAKDKIIGIYEGMLSLNKDKSKAS